MASFPKALLALQRSHESWMGKFPTTMQRVTWIINFSIFDFLCQSIDHWTNQRSSYQRCSVRKRVLRNFTKFTAKHLCQSLFLNKVAGLSLLLNKVTGTSPATFWHRCFPVNFVKFLRTPFLQNTSGRLLLKPKQSNVKAMAFILIN